MHNMIMTWVKCFNWRRCFLICLFSGHSIWLMVVFLGQNLTLVINGLCFSQWFPFVFCACSQLPFLRWKWWDCLHEKGWKEWEHQVCLVMRVRRMFWLDFARCVYVRDVSNNNTLYFLEGITSFAVDLRIQRDSSPGGANAKSRFSRAAVSHRSPSACNLRENEINLFTPFLFRLGAILKILATWSLHFR